METRAEYNVHSENDHDVHSAAELDDPQATIAALKAEIAVLQEKLDDAEDDAFALENADPLDDMPGLRAAMQDWCRARTAVCRDERILSLAQERLLDLIEAYV